ncbi:MAG: HAMP domain-containing protein, partial [Actinomycetota bacterium]
MSLQTRLFLFFITIVVLPLAIASLISQRIIVRELEARARDDLGQGNRAAMDLYERKAGQASDRVQLLVSDREFTRLLLGRRYLELQGLIGDRLGKDGTQIDYLVVADPQGRVLAQAISQAEFLPGVAPPTAEEIASEAGPPHRRLLVTRVAVAIRSGDPLVQVANVFGGYFLDKAFVQDLAATTGLDATVLIDQRAISSTLKAVLQSEQPIFLSVPQDLPRRQPFLKTRIAEETIYTIPAPLAEGIPVSEAALVMSTQERLILGLRRTVLFSMILLVFLAIVGSMLLGLLLSRVIARPLRKLAAGANAIAGGNYDQHIRVRSRDEVGQLARAFNEMAHRLSIHIAQLRDSREEVKRALTRFGEALRATHDEQTLLNVVLETSMDALRAQRGMLMSSTPDADELIFAAARG